MRQRANELARSALQKPYKTLRVCRKIAFGAFAQHRNMTKKTTKPQCEGFAKRTDHEKHAKIPSQMSPGSILEGFGASSAPLGRLLGCSWTVLGGFWTLLGASLVPLGRLLGALGRLLAAICCPRWARARFFIDFGASRALPEALPERFLIDFSDASVLYFVLPVCL